MPTLKPLQTIPVPEPKADQLYRTRVAGQDIVFRGLKQLLGAADYSKAGDRNAGLAAPNEVTREAARLILAGLSVHHVHDHPLGMELSSTGQDRLELGDRRYVQLAPWDNHHVIVNRQHRDVERLDRIR